MTPSAALEALHMLEPLFFFYLPRRGRRACGGAGVRVQPGPRQSVRAPRGRRRGGRRPARGREFETEETGEDDGDADAITVKRHYWDWIHDDGDNERKEVGLLCSVAENCWTSCAAVEQEMSRGMSRGKETETSSIFHEGKIHRMNYNMMKPIVDSIILSYISR